MTSTFRESFSVTHGYPVVFTRQALDPANPALRDAVAQAGPGPHKLAAVLDDGPVRAFPGLIGRFKDYVRHHRETIALAGDPLVVRGGEQAKDGMDLVHQVLELIVQRGLCRQSFVAVLGGGAVLDAVGFAAATAHRGVRLIRLPSTTLAQNDAGVGVKNGINWFGRKNLLGAFAPPYAVINDFSLLDGLAPAERRTGLSEAVKVALIRDRAFFERLFQLRHSLGALESNAVEEAVERCAVLHLEHIAGAGDPFELGSSRPLDFGHWSAHALEELSGWTLSHGDAVGVGVALDSVYSHLAGLLAEADLDDILEVLTDMGFALWSPHLDALDVDAALASFREHLGGELALSLITAPGSRVEVDRVDAGLMRRAIARLGQYAAGLGRERACRR
ncbi:3-dehydroquinate synthase [Fundidesulfovibrio soli]|uniref:3-dehydroquinate synthase n=1 Tax=Fundidesulfovibrio soli TaxID=2922716 RepID=UPI001FAF07ED|nr:3-dehydroquinate synthase [Fundidesulfovibrio soli]